MRVGQALPPRHGEGVSQHLPEQVIDNLDHSTIEFVGQDRVVADPNPLIAQRRTR